MQVATQRLKKVKIKTRFVEFSAYFSFETNAKLPTTIIQSCYDGDTCTTIDGEKTLKRVRGKDLYSGENVSGYEMHIGVTKGPALNRPWLSLEEGRKEGVMSEDGLVMGTYIHGLFESDGFRRAFLRRFRDGEVQSNSYENLLENTLDMLAERLEDHIEMDKLMSLLWR